MFRFIGYLLGIVFLISILRSVIGFVARLVTDWLGNQSRSQVGHPAPAQPGPVSGELKKDPVCGTYIASSTSIKQQIGGKTVHFCSEECRAKYTA